MPKTKPKTKYLKLTFWGWLAFQESGERKAAIVTYLTREARDARRFKSGEGLA